MVRDKRKRERRSAVIKKGGWFQYIRKVLKRPGLVAVGNSMVDECTKYLCIRM